LGEEPFAFGRQRIHKCGLRPPDPLGTLVNETVTLQPGKMLANRVGGDMVLKRQLGRCGGMMALEILDDATARRLEKACFSHQRCLNHYRETSIDYQALS